jgi:hypothetical protein
VTPYSGLRSVSLPPESRLETLGRLCISLDTIKNRRARRAIKAEINRLCQMHLAEVRTEYDLHDMLRKEPAL